MDFENCQHLPQLFEWGITKIVAELKPERAFIACRPRGAEAAKFPIPYSVQGLSLANLFVSEDLSTGVVQQTLRSDEGSLVVDAISSPELSLHTSVVLSGLRSILTTPLRHPSGLNLGLIYADNRVKTGAFKNEHLEFADRIAAQMIAPLGQIEKRERTAPTEILSEEPFDETKSKALRLFREGQLGQSLKTLEDWAQGKEASEEVGVAHGIRGRILEQSGRLEESVEALSKSIWLLGSRATTANEDYALMLNNLAGVHVALGNDTRALGLLTTSSEHWKRLKLPENRQLQGFAAATYNMGSLALKMGDAAQAVAHLTEALAASEKAFGKDHARTEKVRNTLKEARLPKPQ